MRRGPDETLLRANGNLWSRGNSRLPFARAPQKRFANGP